MILACLQASLYKHISMNGYTRWHWKAHDYSSCIVLYPLLVGCHIMSRTKQQWVTVVNSWQNKSRYKCGSCSTCQESTNRCQMTQFKVACPSNIGDMCIHSKMTVQCKTQILHRLFEGNLSITYSDRSRYVMEMLRSLRGDKHEFCLTVIKFSYVRSCPSFDITYTWLHRVNTVVYNAAYSACLLNAVCCFN